MRFIGYCYDILPDDPGTNHLVREAVVTPAQLTVDWMEVGDLMHLNAASKDNGLTYAGTYGFSRADPTCTMQVKRFTASDKSILLFGQWCDRNAGNEGICVFELKPAART